MSIYNHKEILRGIVNRQRGCDRRLYIYGQSHHKRKAPPVTLRILVQSLYASEEGMDKDECHNKERRDHWWESIIG